MSDCFLYKTLISETYISSSMWWNEVMFLVELWLCQNHVTWSMLKWKPQICCEIINIGLEDHERKWTVKEWMKNKDFDHEVYVENRKTIWGVEDVVLGQLKTKMISLFLTVHYTPTGQIWELPLYNRYWVNLL